MSIFNRFFNLFHRKHRFTPEYSTLSFLKKVIFFGMTGFIFSLGASKFILSNLIFSFEPTDENRLYIKLNPSLERGTYYPSMLMVLGIFQRLYAKYRQQQPYLRMEEEEFQGDTLYWVTLHDKAYHLSKKKKQSIPLVLVITGSEGIDNTARHLMLASYNLGYRVVALDPKDLYDTRKIANIVNHLKEKFPKSEVLGVGIEYGANLLVNFQAKNPGSLSGLVSVGNPFDLIKSEINLQESWLWRPLYNSMLNGKKKKALLLNKQLQEAKQLSLFELQKQLYNIQDEKYQDWKAQNSSINAIKDLTVPTFFLQSKEDPFTQSIASDERFENDKCIYVTTQRGGHNEWFENLWMNRWFTAPVKAFLKLVHQRKIEQIQANNKPAAAFQ